MTRALATAETLPNALLAQAQKGDAKALADLRQRLADNPELWNRLSTLTDGLECRLLDGAFGDSNSIARERFERELRQLRRGLGWKTATPLERLCVDRITVTWLHLLLEEHRQAAAREPSTRAVLTRERLVAQAQRRHMAAIKTLAQVRRLMRNPAVQINVGGQQVNVAG